MLQIIKLVGSGIGSGGWSDCTIVVSGGARDCTAYDCDVVFVVVGGVVLGR